MKLLTWMHRKFRQGSGDKEFSLGQQFFDDHHIYQKQNHGNGTLRQGHRDGRQTRNSFANLETTRMEYIEGRTSTESDSEFFEGFLAIGTLGTEKVITEPETPTFAVSFERLAEGETEVTENELRLINDELERVLAAEAKDEGWTDSSGRNSHASNGRISHASTITLSEKPLEISETIGAGALICPLQEYLLGSAVELQMPERTAAPKKENRTSLGELFEKHKAEVSSEAKCGRGERKQDKEGEKSSKNIMKKILKKKTSHASSRSLSSQTIESPAPETKLSKILHKFHKKVHPEISQDNGMKSMNVSYYTLREESMVSFPQRGVGKDDNGRHKKSYSNSWQLIGDGSNSSGSRECWIKTDADYLVLEL